MSQDLIARVFPAFVRSPDDIRAAMLARVFGEIERSHSVERLRQADNPRLIAALIPMIRRCRFSPFDFEAFKQRMLEDARPAFERYADILRDTLDFAEPFGSVDILSIGCGGSGHIERFLDERISIGGPGAHPVDIRWIGTDICEPDEDSFFRSGNNRYLRIEAHDETPYARRAGTDPAARASKRTVLIAQFAYHHMDIEFSEFLGRCRGADRLLLLEELIDGAAWTDGDFRIARIACDLLSNMGFNPDWAGAYMHDPSLFKVRYLPRDLVRAKGGTIIDLPGCSPELSVVVIAGP